MYTKHVANGIIWAWNSIYYRYVGDVSSIPKLSSTRPRVGKTITTNNFWGDMLSHNLDHNIAMFISWMKWLKTMVYNLLTNRYRGSHKQKLFMNSTFKTSIKKFCTRGNPSGNIFKAKGIEATQRLIKFQQLLSTCNIYISWIVVNIKQYNKCNRWYVRINAHKVDTSVCL